MLIIKKVWFGSHTVVQFSSEMHSRIVTSLYAHTLLNSMAAHWLLMQSFTIWESTSELIKLLTSFIQNYFSPPLLYYFLATLQETQYGIDGTWKLFHWILKQLLYGHFNPQTPESLASPMSFTLTELGIFSSYLSFLLLHHTSLG